MISIATIDVRRLNIRIRRVADLKVFFNCESVLLDWQYFAVSASTVRMWTSVSTRISKSAGLGGVLGFR